MFLKKQNLIWMYPTSTCT